MQQRQLLPWRDRRHERVGQYTTGSPVTNINFSLRQGPRIVGRVTNSAGAGVANATVAVHRVTGSWFGASFVQTDGTGDFKSGGLPPGIPFTLVTSNSGLIDKSQGIGSRYFTVNNILASQRFASPSRASMRAQANSAPAGPPVAARIGFDRTQPMLALDRDPLGGRFTAVGQLGRLELRFGQACGVVKGVQIANGERTPLPVGSTLEACGSFHWMPGPAFLSTYELEFSVPSCDGAETKIPVTVAVLPGR